MSEVEIAVLREACLLSYRVYIESKDMDDLDNILFMNCFSISLIKGGKQADWGSKYIAEAGELLIAKVEEVKPDDKP